MGVQLDWYDHVPKLVETGHEGTVTIKWNQQVQTDRTTHNTKMDFKMCGDEMDRF